MEVYLLRLHINGCQDVCMFPQSYMNTEVLVEKRQMLNIVSSLGDAGIQRSVYIESDEEYAQ